jgi:phage terminase small subunit
MNRKTSAASGTLTPKQLKFVAAWQGDVVAAARAAGYRKPESMAYKLMDDPAVANEIRRKQRIMTEESAKRLAGQLKVPKGRSESSPAWSIAECRVAESKGYESGF